MTLEKVAEKRRMKIGCILDRLCLQGTGEAALHERTPDGGRVLVA